MPSFEPESRCGKISGTFRIWIRKLHSYSGLYFLFFLWLFSLTGLLLNHSKWEFAQFWPQRVESTVTVPIGEARDATALMRQLGLRGEVDRIKPAAAPDNLSFRVTRPGRIVDVTADLQRRQAAVKTIALNGWGIVHMLHTFSGVRKQDPKMQRNWALTSLWSFSMDALSVGLIFMVFGGYYIWYVQSGKRCWGWIAVVAGLLSCGLFLFLPVWFRVLRM